MLAVLAVLLYEIRVALLPFVFAIAAAFVTDPWIKSLQHRLGSPRWPVAAGFFLLILALLGGAGYWIGTTAVSDLMSVVARAPDILRHFLTEILGNKGITVFGETYTPDKAVKALGAAMSGVVGFSAVKGIASNSRLDLVRDNPDLGSNAVFHDIGAKVGRWRDLAAAARAPPLGRGSAP